MFKKISNLFCLFFLFIFVSCNNVFDNGEKTKDISFSLGEEVAAALVNRAGAGTEYTVNFTFDGIDREPFSVTVAKDKLGTTKFNIDNIPINKPFTISMRIRDGKKSIYGGRSNVVTVTKAGCTEPVTITLGYPYTEVPVKVGTIKINLTPEDPSAEQTSDVVIFGDWPQTLLEDEAIITDKNKTVKINGWDCYRGSDLNYYVKVRPTPADSVKQFDSSKDYYFRMEPIRWRVLTDDYNGRKLLYSMKILDKCSFFPSSQGTRTISGKTIHINNYKYSEIRAFLNGYEYFSPDSSINKIYTGKGFLQRAFTPYAIAKIADTDVDNSESSVFATGGPMNSNPYTCDNTKDKIFLLSAKEFTTAAYTFADYNKESTSRRFYATDYGRATGVYVNNSFNQACNISLRSPYNYEYLGQSDDIYVYKGTASGSCSFTSCSPQDSLGVVPALSISF